MVGCSNIFGFVRYDAAVKAGGREVGLQTQWTHRLDTSPAHVAGYSPFTFLQDKLSTLYHPHTHTYTLIGGQPPSSTPAVKQRSVMGTFSQQRRVWGKGGRERLVVNNTVCNDVFSGHRQSQRSTCLRYLMTLTSVGNTVCRLQDTAALASCLSFSPGT